MGSNGMSRTAQAAAASRAIESCRPSGKRLFEDPLAHGFLANRIRRATIDLMRISPVRNAALAMRDRQFPGAMGWLLCRTLYIDEALQDALAGGVEQIVLLGAGFDSRAYRIPGIEQVPVFEVDKPATLAWKQQCLGQMLGSLPSHVRFVPIDMDRQTLEQALPAAGFRTGSKTFFIWEGATQYFTAAAVDKTLRYVSHTAPAGSQIVFTYIHRGVFDGSVHSDGVEAAISLAERSGEPWLFGIDPPELGSYLAARGLALVEQVGASECKKRYLETRGRRMKVMDLELAALAKVAGTRSELEASCCHEREQAEKGWG